MEFLYLLLNTVAVGLSAATLLSAILLVFASCYVLKRRFSVTKEPQPPKAGHAWPIVGHLPLLAGPHLLHLSLGALADKHGPIFTIQLGMHQALVVSNWEMVKELYATNDLAISTRPNLTAMRHLSYNFSMFAFAPLGAYWRDMRKIVTQEMHSTDWIEIVKRVRISEVEASLKEVHELWTERKNDLGNALIDLKQLFEDLTLNVILRTVAGIGGGSVNDKKMARRCQKALKEFFRLLGQFVMRDAFPFLGWLDIGRHEKAMKSVAKELDDIVGEWLKEHRNNIRISGHGADAEGKDFMDTMLSVLEGKDFEGYSSDVVNKAASLTMIAGSGNTSAVVLTWAVSLLLNNKHIKKKAQEELDTFVGRERLVDESDISKLVYLQAIVKETLRLCPPVPLSGPRGFAQDCCIGGYHVKKGTRLITNLWKIHTDPRIWPNPMEFKPERFLTSHKHIDVKGRHFELLPFGSGRRVCPGISFGLEMVHVTLANFLQAFEISSPSEAPIDMTGSRGQTNMKANPLDVFISPRLPIKLYA